MTDTKTELGEKLLTEEELHRLALDIIQKMQAVYDPGRDRIVTPENVFQPAVKTGRQELEDFQLRLFLPGSRIDGLENLDHCLGEMDRGRRIVFLPEHRGNLDVPSFNALLTRENARYARISDRLVYVAGRKLNESSEFIKMFTEKYSRLVIATKREYPPKKTGETDSEREHREAFEKEAGRINRAAFRAMERLKKDGYIFVLFPTGGRVLPGQDNLPVKETTTYLRTFDTAYPISMEGNALPPSERMEDDRPVQQRVVFRVGKPLDCKDYLAQRQQAFQALAGGAQEVDGIDADQFTVNHIMELLASLRETGRYPE